MTADDTFDAVAWIDGPRALEQVEALVVDEIEQIFATGRTLGERRDREEEDKVEEREHDR